MRSGRGAGMVRGDCSGILGSDDVTMRRQGQEQRVSAMEVHPLEGLRVARPAGLDRDLAGLPFARRPKRIARRVSGARCGRLPRSTTRNAVALPAPLTDCSFPSTTASAFPLARSVSVMDCETGIGLVSPRGRGSSR